MYLTVNMISVSLYTVAYPAPIGRYSLVHALRTTCFPSVQDPITMYLAKVTGHQSMCKIFLESHSSFSSAQLHVQASYLGRCGAIQILRLYTWRLSPSACKGGTAPPPSLPRILHRPTSQHKISCCIAHGQNQTSAATQAKQTSGLIFT